MSEEKERGRYIGRLEPRYTFFLNPYQDHRFTRCPGCGERMRTRKEPFFIHVNPMESVVLNMTARYCPDCDLLVLHQDVVEGLLVWTFEQHKPEVIGNDYSIIGTVERSYWRKYKGQITMGPAIEHLHDFESVVQYSPLHYGWVPNEDEQDKEHE